MVRPGGGAGRFLGLNWTVTDAGVRVAVALTGLCFEGRTRESEIVPGLAAADGCKIEVTMLGRPSSS